MIVSAGCCILQWLIAGPLQWNQELHSPMHQMCSADWVQWASTGCISFGARWHTFVGWHLLDLQG